MNCTKVYDLDPLDEAGSRCMHVIRVGHSERRISTITPTLPKQVIVAAHAYGHRKLLFALQHKAA